jgi:hypothetical protein
VRESKFKKLGRENGRLACIFIGLNSRKSRISIYTSEFLKELENYSFKEHREGTPRHEGCVSWIEKITDRVDYDNPRQYAIKVKADLDGLQQKRHARNYYLGFIEGLEEHKLQTNNP